MKAFDTDFYLKQLVKMGAAPALINDDNGKWVVLFNGIQPADGGDGQYIYFADADTKWYPTPLEAVRTAYEEENVMRGDDS
jgi:hypothetical protein